MRQKLMVVFALLLYGIGAGAVGFVLGDDAQDCRSVRDEFHGLTERTRELLDNEAIARAVELVEDNPMCFAEEVVRQNEQFKP